MNNILGERAKELRLQLGMTQADVVNELKRSHNITIRQNLVSRTRILKPKYRPASFLSNITIGYIGA